MILLQALPIVLVQYTISQHAPSRAKNDLEGAIHEMKNPSDGNLLTALAIGGAIAVAVPAIAYLVKSVVDSVNKSREEEQGRQTSQGPSSANNPQNESCTIN